MRGGEDCRFRFEEQRLPGEWEKERKGFTEGKGGESVRK